MLLDECLTEEQVLSRIGLAEGAKVERVHLLFRSQQPPTKTLLGLSELLVLRLLGNGCAPCVLVVLSDLPGGMIQELINFMTIRGLVDHGMMESESLMSLLRLICEQQHRQDHGGQNGKVELFLVGSGLLAIRF